MISELHTPDPVVSTAHFSLVHPVIATLEAAMVDQENLVNVATQANNEGQKDLERIESTQWTHRIESAVDKPEELALIRRQYDESALKFMSAWMTWIGARRKMMDGRSRMSDIIVTTLIALEQLDHPLKEVLTPILQARLVAASELHGRDVIEKVIPHHSAHKNRVEVKWLEPNQTLVTLLDRVQANAFKVLVAGLSANTRQDIYTTAFAVGDKTRANSSNPDGFESRYIQPVEFVDCVNSSHPESAQLFELLSQMKAAHGNCYERHSIFTKQQIGSVNERQHGDRLLKFLHSEPAVQDAYGKVDNLEEQIKAQNQRRYDFESDRQQFALSVRYLRALLVSIAKALKASVAETEALLTQVEAEKNTTIDRLETLRIMINNCLAADASMRHWVGVLLSHEHTLANDISDGAGSRRIRGEFEAVAKRYGYQVKKRKEELAPKPEAAIDSTTSGASAD